MLNQEMKSHGQRTSESGPADKAWGASMRGGWLNALSPSISLLVTATAERIGLPGWLSALAILLVWFVGFFVLIRAQFGRRHRNADVFKAFLCTTMLGFLVVAGLLVAMYFIPQAGMGS